MGFLSRDNEPEDPEAKRRESQEAAERDGQISLAAIPTTPEALQAAALAELAEAFLLGFFQAGTKGDKEGRELRWVIAEVHDNLMPDPAVIFPSDATKMVVNEAFQLLELNRFLYRYRDNVRTGVEQWFLTRRGRAAVAAGRAEISE